MVPERPTKVQKRQIMNVQQLIFQLYKLDPFKEVMILDGFNGAGDPRTINLGPTIHKITEANREFTADCEDMPLEHEVVVLGYGCYYKN
jgi:hypothetical protein